MESTLQGIFAQTIDIKALTLADWIEIAKHCDNSNKWAYYKWVESIDLSVVTLDEWESIAELLEYSGNWAYRQFSEKRKK